MLWMYLCTHFTPTNLFESVAQVNAQTRGTNTHEYKYVWLALFMLSMLADCTSNLNASLYTIKVLWTLSIPAWHCVADDFLGDKHLARDSAPIATSMGDSNMTAVARWHKCAFARCLDDVTNIVHSRELNQYDLLQQ